MSSSDIDSEYVQKISGKKKENGSVFYKVVWKQPEEWIKEEQLLLNCKDLIKKFNDHDQVDSPNMNPSEQVKELSLTSPGKDNKSLHDIALKRPTREEWYKNDVVTKKIKEFNDKCCKTPNLEIQKAKGRHQIIMQQLQQAFKIAKDIDFKKLEFTGSSYEGLKITSDGLEFDVMFIMDGTGLDVKLIADREGYCNLVPKDSDDEKYKKYLDGQHMSPEKIKGTFFFSTVQTFVDSICRYPGEIKVSQHGPAVQIDVKKDKRDHEYWYSVDLVPCFEVRHGGELLRYVPKPLNEPDDGEKRLANSWRRSFSEEEKGLLKGLDKDNGCRRQVARIMKGIFHNEPTTYKPLNSYHIKTLLFHTLDMKDDKITWKDKDYPERVFDMLGILEAYLRLENLPHYFIPSINLIENIKGSTLENIRSRIACIRSSETKFFKTIEPKT